MPTLPCIVWLLKYSLGLVHENQRMEASRPFSLSQLGEVLRNKATMQIAESRTYF